MDFFSNRIYEDCKNFFSKDFLKIKKLILNPIIKDAKYLSLIKEMKEHFSKEFIEILNELQHIAAYKREQILEEFFVYVSSIHEKKYCKVITKFELNDEEKMQTEKMIKEKVKIDGLKFDYFVNSHIIKGIIFKIDNFCYDLTLNKIIDEMKEEMKK